MTLRPLLIASLLCISTHAADAPMLKDDFAAAKHPQRRAARGDWKFTDGAATCTQDDALYAKNKDHGPIIFYDLDYSDATIRFSYKADAATKTFVFTCNGEDGHIFRFVTNATGTGIRGFPAGGKEHESISLGLEKAVTLKPEVWVPVVVTLRGPKAMVKMGDFEKAFEHPSLARAKTNLSVGFSFGTLSVKDVSVEK